MNYYCVITVMRIFPFLKCNVQSLEYRVRAVLCLILHTSGTMYHVQLTISCVRYVSSYLHCIK